MGILRDIFKLRSKNPKIKTKEIVKKLSNKSNPSGKKMVAIFKRTKGSNRKWVSTADFGKPKPQPTKKSVLIKKPMDVDGQVWDNGQTVEREDE